MFRRLDSHGDLDAIYECANEPETATRTWMVRANQNPSVTITTPGGQQTPGTTIDLAATTSGPESNQAVTVSWEIISGDGSLSNPTSLDSAQITFLGYYTTSEQTVQVRITATDNLGATGADTVDFTLPAPRPPDIPDTIQLTVLNMGSIRATFDDPPSHLPITQRDIFYRQTGEQSWTNAEFVALPYTIANLSPNTTYEVKGQAHSAAGASGWGRTAEVTITAITSPTLTIDTAFSLLGGLESVTVSGTVTDAQDDDGSVVVTASTDIGTVSAPVNTDGTWTLTLIAPAVTTAQQAITLAVTATNSHGGTTSAVHRPWMVRANQNPSVMITTPGGQQTPGTTIDLAATVSGPESNQAVPVSWWIVSGDGFISDSSPLDPAQITFPGYTTSGQTVQVWAVVMNRLGAMEIDTVDFTLPAARPPDIPDTIQLTVLDMTSIRASFANPPSHLPVTQLDVRYRQRGTPIWTELTDVSLPHTIPNLNQGMEYEVEGRAHSAAGASGWGGTSEVTTTLFTLQVE